jgi:hypothetical protein
MSRLMMEGVFQFVNVEDFYFVWAWIFESIRYVFKDWKDGECSIPVKNLVILLCLNLMFSLYPLP